MRSRRAGVGAGGVGVRGISPLSYQNLHVYVKVRLGGRAAAFRSPDPPQRVRAAPGIVPPVAAPTEPPGTISRECRRPHARAATPISSDRAPPSAIANGTPAAEATAPMVSPPSG